MYVCVCMYAYLLVTMAHERPDCGGRGVEVRHVVLVDDLPAARHGRVCRHALKQNLSRRKNSVRCQTTPSNRTYYGARTVCVSDHDLKQNLSGRTQAQYVSDLRAHRVYAALLQTVSPRSGLARQKSHAYLYIYIFTYIYTRRQGHMHTCVAPLHVGP